MSCNVASIRSKLTPEENAVYKDHRIEWWIQAKKGSMNAVLHLIASNHANEMRMKDIVTNPQRREATLKELSRNVMSIIHAPPRHEMALYINCRNKNKQFNAQLEGDALLVAMYYLLHKVEELEGPGHTAICIIDMMEAPTPKPSDMQSQSKMFSDIVDRSFAGLFSQQLLCCNWNAFARKAISSIANSVGQPTEFVSPDEVIKKFGKEFSPIQVGGDFNLEAGKPTGALAFEYVEQNLNKLVPAKTSAVASAPESATSDVVPSGPSSMVDQYAPFWAAICVVVAICIGEYISLTLFAAGLLYLKFGKGLLGNDERAEIQSNTGAAPVAAPEQPAREGKERHHRFTPENNFITSLVHERKASGDGSDDQNVDEGRGRRNLPIIGEHRPRNPMHYHRSRSPTSREPVSPAQVPHSTPSNLSVPTPPGSKPTSGAYAVPPSPTKGPRIDRFKRPIENLLHH